MRSIHWIGVVLAVFVGAGILGCSKGSEMVARVGDQTISAEDLKLGFESRPQTFASFDEELERRREFLNGMIDRKLLLIGAYEQGLDSNDEIQRLIEQQRAKFLLDQLYKQEIADKVDVDEADIRTWYENMGEEIHARHILLETQATADSIRAELEQGADFATLARERSKDPSAAQNAGDLSWFRWGTMVQPFQEAAFALGENEISTPVQTDFGWHVIQLLGRRQVDRQPYDQVQGQIRQQLTQQHTQLRLRDFLGDMKAKAEVRLDLEQLALIQEMFRDTVGPLPYASNWDATRLNEKEQKRPIVRYLDTALEVGQFLTLANQVPPMNRPRLDDTLALKEFIFQMIYVPILEREALRLRIDQTDDYKRAIQNFRETLMADKMRTDLVQRPVDISEEELRTYYDENLDEYSSPPQVRVREALVATQQEAQDIIARVRRGAKFDRICAEVTLRPGMKAKKGDLGLFRRFSYPGLFDAAQQMTVGQVGGPVYHATKEGGQWSVIELLSKQDAVTRSFTEVQDQIRNKLANDKRAAALQAWLDEMRSQVNVQINEDALAATIDKGRYPEQG